MTIEKITITPSYETQFNYFVPKKPKVKKRKALFIFVTITLLIAIISAFIYFAILSKTQNFLSVFTLSEITIFGGNDGNREIIEEALKDLKGSNLLFVSANQISEKLSQFGFIEGFQFKKFYPSKLSVEIIIRKPIGKIKIKNNYYDIDGMGNYWESNAEEGIFVEVENRELLKDINFHLLFEKIKAKNILNEISLIKGCEPESFEITFKDGTKILVFSENFEEEWDKYLKISDFLKENFKTNKVIDLRWSKRVVLREDSLEEGV